MEKQTATPPARDYTDDYQDSVTYGEPEQEMLKFQLDVKPLLDDFEHRVLRGQYEHVNNATGEKGWKFFDEKAKPLISETGIREIMGRLMGYANIATKLSYYEDE
jgi:hypothetical protein